MLPITIEAAVWFGVTIAAAQANAVGSWLAAITIFRSVVMVKP